VQGKAHGGLQGGAFQGGLGEEAGAEAVRGGESGGVAGHDEEPLEDLADGVGVEGAAEHGAGFGDRAEEGAGREVGGVEPVFDGLGGAAFQEQLWGGAFGGGFGFQQADVDEVGIEGEVFHVQPGDFGAAAAAGGPAQHQDGAVAGAA